MSLKINVVLQDQNKQQIAILSDKPIRVSSWGTGGMVHQGVVYPLYEGFIVFEQSEVFSKNEFPNFAESMDDFQFQNNENAHDHFEFYFEQSKYASYLAISGNEDEIEDFFNFCESQNLAERKGLSFRPAKDGIQYDYFFRLNRNVEKHQIEKAISEFHPSLTPKENKDISEDSDASLNEFKKKNAELNEKIELLEKQVSSNAEEILALKINNDELLLKLNDAEKIGTQYKSELEAIKKREISKDKELGQVIDNEVADLTNLVKKLETENQELKIGIKSETSKQTAMGNKINDLEQTISDLRSQLHNNNNSGSNVGNIYKS